MRTALGFVTSLIGDTFINIPPGEGQLLLSADLPNFDMHRVEQALRVNHVLYNGTPLSEADIQSGIDGYRQFLARHKAAGMPKQFEVPSYLIDRVWHAHMCETGDYARDMQAYFGQMFHHASGICNGGGAPDITPIQSH